MIEVEATFTARGEARPRQILWEGELLAVVDTGRRWTDAAGQHMLVRVSDQRTFELTYNGVGWTGKVVSQTTRFV